MPVKNSGNLLKEPRIYTYKQDYKQDFALNNLEGLIYHKTQPTNQSTAGVFSRYY